MGLFDAVIGSGTASPDTSTSLTGASAPVPGRSLTEIASLLAAHYGQGLRDMIEGPGSAMRDGVTSDQAADWAAGTSLNMLGLSRLPGAAPQGTVGTFAGPKSKVWDPPAAAATERMSPDAAWRQTGYGDRFADQKMRTEIPDTNAQVFAEFGAQGPSQSKPLSSVLSHPELFAAYPELKDVSVVRKEPSSGSANASYDPKTNTISVSPRVTDVKKAVLHELQHKIDDLEGLSRGSSFGEHVSLLRKKSLDDVYGAYRNTAGEANARLTEARSEMTPQQLREAPPWSMFDVPLEQQVHRGTDADVRRSSRNSLIGMGASGAVTTGALTNLINQLLASRPGRPAAVDQSDARPELLNAILGASAPNSGFVQ